jgi:hypothetical protein
MAVSGAVRIRSQASRNSMPPRYSQTLQPELKKITFGKIPFPLFQIDVSDKFCYQTDDAMKLGGGVWGL